MVFVFLIVPPDTGERPDDIVGVDYFAKRAGLSARTVRDGKAGTRAVPRARRRPLGWLRRDVDAFVAREKDGPAQFAAKLVERRGRKAKAA